MCLVLLYVGNEDAGDAKQVILAANRDEFFSRPTTASKYYVDPGTSFRKSFRTKSLAHEMTENFSLHNGWKKPFVMLGPRDDKFGDDKRPLLGSPFLVGSGKRWAVITNALGPWDEDQKVSNPRCKRFWSFLWKQDLGSIGVLLFAFGAALSRCRSFKVNWKYPNLYSAVSVFLFMLAVLVTLALKKSGSQEKGHNGLRSRGHLLPSFVDSQLTPEEFIERLEKRPDLKFDGFSILLGVGNHAYFVTNRPAIKSQETRNGIRKMKLDKGKIYGLSNAFLDDPRGRVERGKRLFTPIIHRLGCGVGGRGGTGQISMETRKSVVNDLFQDVMGNAEKCETIPTTLNPEVDDHLARVFIPAFSLRTNPETKKPGTYGTRDTIFMVIGFNEETDNLVGLDGICLWEIDHSQKKGGSSGEILEFNEETHQDAARHHLKYWRRGPSLGFGSIHFSTPSSHSADSNGLPSHSTNGNDLPNHSGNGSGR